MSYFSGKKTIPLIYRIGFTLLSLSSRHWPNAMGEHLVSMSEGMLSYCPIIIAFV